MPKRSHGFTLVELLIVIVVIGVLASITVIAYNGIQDRARQSRMLAAMDGAEKSFRLYYAEKGSYPQSPPGNPQPACMGDRQHYPATSDFQEGECFVQISGGARQSASVSDYMNTQFRAAGLDRAIVDGSFPVSTFTLGGATLKTRGVAVGYAESNGEPAIDLTFYRDNKVSSCGGRFETHRSDDPNYQYMICALSLRP